MSDLPTGSPDLPLDLQRWEGYFVELLNKLERIASVMERFDNVMNPTLGAAEEALNDQMARRADEESPAPMFLRQVR